MPSAQRFHRDEVKKNPWPAPLLLLPHVSFSFSVCSQQVFKNLVDCLVGPKKNVCTRTQLVVFICWMCRSVMVTQASNFRASFSWIYFYNFFFYPKFWLVPDGFLALCGIWLLFCVFVLPKDRSGWDRQERKVVCGGRHNTLETWSALSSPTVCQISSQGRSSNFTVTHGKTATCPSMC